MRNFLTSFGIALIITAIFIIFEIGELILIAASVEAIGVGWTVLITCVLVFVLVAAIVALIYRIFGPKRWYRKHRHHGRRY